MRYFIQQLFSHTYGIDEVITSYDPVEHGCKVVRVTYLLWKLSRAKEIMIIPPFTPTYL